MLDCICDQFACNKAKRDALCSWHPKFRTLDGDATPRSLAGRHVREVATKALEILFELKACRMVQSMQMSMEPTNRSDTIGRACQKRSRFSIFSRAALYRNQTGDQLQAVQQPVL